MVANFEKGQRKGYKLDNGAYEEQRIRYKNKNFLEVTGISGKPDYVHIRKNAANHGMSRQMRKMEHRIRIGRISVRIYMLDENYGGKFEFMVRVLADGF